MCGWNQSNQPSLGIPRLRRPLHVSKLSTWKPFGLTENMWSKFSLLGREKMPLQRYCPPTPHPPSPSALPVTWPALYPVPMNKRPSQQYYSQLTPRATSQSESSTDTNFPSKRSHHCAQQPSPSSPPPSLATSSQVVDTPGSSAFQLCHSRYRAFQCGPTILVKINRAFIKNMKYQ